MSGAGVILIDHGDIVTARISNTHYYINKHDCFYTSVQGRPERELSRFVSQECANYLHEFTRIF